MVTYGPEDFDKAVARVLPGWQQKRARQACALARRELAAQGAYTEAQVMGHALALLPELHAEAERRQLLPAPHESTKRMDGVPQVYRSRAQMPGALRAALDAQWTGRQQIRGVI